MLKENLVMLRGLHGFSQEQIAERIGISRQAYAKWESGETIPDVMKCYKLAETYGTTVDELLHTENVEGMGLIPPAPKGKHMYGTVTVNERGQMVIPKAARDQFNLTGGTRLIVLGDESEGIALVPVSFFEKNMQKLAEMIRAENKNAF